MIAAEATTDPVMRISLCTAHLELRRISMGKWVADSTFVGLGSQVLGLHLAHCAACGQLSRLGVALQQHLQGSSVTRSTVG